MSIHRTQATPRQYTPRQFDQIEDRLRRLERQSGANAEWVEYVPEITLYTDAYGTSGDPVTVMLNMPNFDDYAFIWGAYSILGSTMQLYGHMEQDEGSWRTPGVNLPFLGTPTTGAYYRIGFPPGVTPVSRHADDVQLGQADWAGPGTAPGVSLYRPGNTTRPGGDIAALELWVTTETYRSGYTVVTERVTRLLASDGTPLAYATWAWTGEVTVA